MFEQHKLLSNNCHLVTSYFKTSGLWRTILKKSSAGLDTKEADWELSAPVSSTLGKPKPAPWGALQEPKFTINNITFLILSFSQTA